MGMLHDVGVTPAYYRWLAHKQIGYYKTVDATNGTVMSIKPEGNYTYFTVTARANYHGQTSSHTARKIILATGMRDIIPQTPGLQQNFGKGIYWCPWCDGMEHADQPMGILGPFDDAVANAAEVATLHNNTIIFANGTDTLENRARADQKFAKHSSAYLTKRGIKVDNRMITRFTRIRDGEDPQRDSSLPTTPEYDLFKIEFETGPPVNRSVMFTAFAAEQRSTLGVRLGTMLREGKIVVDENMCTSVPGIYAAGDANSDKRTNVLHALHSGKSAAIHVHSKFKLSLTHFASCKAIAKLLR